MVKALFIMLMVIFTKANGSTIKLVVKVLTPTKTVQNLSESGKTINNMGSAFSSGLMDKYTRDNTKMERKPEKVSSNL